MADISQINLNGTTYDVADASARTQGATNATNITRISSQISGKQDAFTFNPDDFSFDDTTNTVSLKGGATLVIDNALSATSQNPVQNRVVTVNLNTKQDLLADSNDITVNADGTLNIRRDNLIDSSLSATSTNAIANNAVNTAITGINTAITTVNGAVATLNGDSETVGSVDYKIAQALSSASGLAVVTALPAVGDEKTVYVLKGARNKMYVWADNAFLPVSDYDAAIAQLQATIGDSTSGLVKDIADLNSDMSDAADAIATINGTDTGSSMRDVAEDVVSTIPKSIVPKGTIAFEDLPALDDVEIGYMYNISDAFTTTADFIMGAGTSMQANSNVYVIDAGSGTKKYDVFATPGIADMSAYQTKTLNNPVTVDEVEQTTVEGAVAALNDYADDIKQEAEQRLKVVSSIPASPSDGQVVLYVGATTSDYKQGGIYRYDGTAEVWSLISTADVEVDSALSTTSTNPVQNKVVTEALGTKLPVVDELPDDNTDYDNVILATDGHSYKWDDENSEWVDCTPTPVIPEPDLSAYKKQFNGTLAEWNALSEDEQAGYDSAAIDDVAGAGSMLTGTVEEGNENAVTSDAVAKAIADSIVWQTVTVTLPANSDSASIAIAKSGYKPIAATVVYVSYVTPCYCFLETDANLTVKAQNTVSSATNIQVRIVWQKQ